MVWETGVQSKIESYQRLKIWYFMTPCLTLSIIKYWSRVKWINPWKGVAPFPTLQCSSYWKGSLQVIPETQKMVLDASLLNTQRYKVGIKVKVERYKEKSSATLFISVSILSKREPSSHPQLSIMLLIIISSIFSFLIGKWIFCVL